MSKARKIPGDEFESKLKHKEHGDAVAIRYV